MKKLQLIQCALTVPKKHNNSYGNYDYRNCEDILEALKPHLKEHDCIITLNDEIILVGDRHYIKATATLTDCVNTDIPPGHKVPGPSVSTSALARETFERKKFDQSQLTGSASSYARKFALCGLFALDESNDADTRDNSKTETAGRPSAVAKDDPKPPAAEPKNAEGKTREDLRNSFLEMYKANPQLPALEINLSDKIKTLGDFYTWVEAVDTRGKLETFEKILNQMRCSVDDVPF